MSYYLKYLKYKQKYLDLKNLDLFSGISLGNYNYKDLEGGVLGLKENKTDHKNIEDIAKLWQDVSLVSHTLTPNPVTQRIQPGYFLNYQVLRPYPGYESKVMEKYMKSEVDDQDNHIHLLYSNIGKRLIPDAKREGESFKEDQIIITYALKVDGKGIVIPKMCMDQIRSFKSKFWIGNNQKLLEEKIEEILQSFIAKNGGMNQFIKLGENRKQSIGFLKKSYNDNLSEGQIKNVLRHLEEEALACVVLKKIFKAMDIATRTQQRLEIEKLERERDAEIFVIYNTISNGTIVPDSDIWSIFELLLFNKFNGDLQNMILQNKWDLVIQNFNRRPSIQDIMRRFYKLINDGNIRINDINLDVLNECYKIKAMNIYTDVQHEKYINENINYINEDEDEDEERRAGAGPGPMRTDKPTRTYNPYAKR